MARPSLRSEAGQAQAHRGAHGSGGVQGRVGRAARGPLRPRAGRCDRGSVWRLPRNRRSVPCLACRLTQGRRSSGSTPRGLSTARLHGGAGREAVR
eukprot:scaffold1248_cov393-Prasinococcus_capsulatus_cf.AAC.39